MIATQTQNPITVLEIEKNAEKLMLAKQDVVILEAINLIKEVGEKITTQHINHYTELKQSLNEDIEKRTQWLENYNERRRKIANENNVNWIDVIPLIPENERLKASNHEEFLPKITSQRDTIFQYTLPKYQRLSFQNTIHEFQGLFQKDIINRKEIKSEINAIKQIPTRFFTPYISLPESNKKDIFRAIYLDLQRIMTLYFTTWGKQSKDAEIKNWFECFLQEYSYCGISKGIKEFLASEKSSADYSFKLQSVIPFIQKHHKEGLTILANINWLLSANEEIKKLN